MTNEITTTGILSLFETTKAERQNFVQEVIGSLDEGFTDALKIHLQVKSAEDLIKQLTGNEEYKSHVLNAAQKYGAKSFEFVNSKMEIKEVGTKYDYANCNDAELIDITKQVEELTEKLKARQKFLQTVPLSGLTLVNEVTGETYTVYPPSKSSTTSVAVTLK